MSGQHHVDPNPVRPSSAEGDPEEVLDRSFDQPEPPSPGTPHAEGHHVDPHFARPSQAEGEAD